MRFIYTVKGDILLTGLSTEKEIQRIIGIVKKQRKYLNKLNKLIFEAEYGFKPLAYEHIQRHKPFMKGKAAYKILLGVRELLFRTMEYLPKVFEEEKKITNVLNPGVILGYLGSIHKEVALAFTICERLLSRRSEEPQVDISAMRRLILNASLIVKDTINLDKKRTETAIRDAVEAQKQKLGTAA